MTSLFRLTRQIRPIHPLLVRSFASKPPPPPTITHTPLHGEKSIPDVDQTTTHVPAPTPPPEDHAPIPADIVSGAPEDMHRRTVRIYRPAKSAMQSGLHGNLYWRLDWDVQPEDNRWEHPVMFWAARSVQGWCGGLIVVEIICRGRGCSLILKKLQLRLLRNKVFPRSVYNVDGRMGILHSRTS